MVHSLVDFNLQIPANAALFYAMCTIAAIPARFSSRRRGRNSRSNPQADSAACPIS